MLLRWEAATQLAGGLERTDPTILTFWGAIGAMAAAERGMVPPPSGPGGVTLLNSITLIHPAQCAPLYALSSA